MSSSTPSPIARPPARRAGSPATPQPRQRQPGTPAQRHPTKEEPEPVNERDLPSHSGRDDDTGTFPGGVARQRQAGRRPAASPWRQGRASPEAHAQ